MTSEGPFHANQQHGLMHELETGLVKLYAYMSGRCSVGVLVIVLNSSQEKPLCPDHGPSLDSAPDPKPVIPH